MYRQIVDMFPSDSCVSPIPPPPAFPPPPPPPPPPLPIPPATFPTYMPVLHSRVMYVPVILELPSDLFLQVDLEDQENPDTHIHTYTHTHTSKLNLTN